MHNVLARGLDCHRVRDGIPGHWYLPRDPRLSDRLDKRLLQITLTFYPNNSVLNHAIRFDGNQSTCQADDNSPTWGISLNRSRNGRDTPSCSFMSEEDIASPQFRVWEKCWLRLRATRVKSYHFLNLSLWHTFRTAPLCQIVYFFSQSPFLIHYRPLVSIALVVSTFGSDTQMQYRKWTAPLWGLEENHIESHARSPWYGFQVVRPGCGLAR